MTRRPRLATFSILAVLAGLAVAAATLLIQERAPRGPASPEGEASARAPAPPPPAPGTAPPAPPRTSPSASVTAGSAAALRDPGVSGPPDTARGTIAVVGPYPTRTVVLTPAQGPEITLTGAHRESLERLSGTEVWVSGRADPQRRELAVAAFEVRSVDGVPATDGILTADGDSLVLVTRDGRRRAVRDAPPALRALLGAHVWVSGSPDREPQAFGLIRRAP